MRQRAREQRKTLEDICKDFFFFLFVSKSPPDIVSDLPYYFHNVNNKTKSARQYPRNYRFGIIQVEIPWTAFK